VQTLVARPDHATADARVVEGAVDASERGDRARDRSHHVGLVRDVATDGDGLTARGVDQRYGFRRAFLGPVGDRDTRTFTGHGQRCGSANARGAAGHERGFTRENACHGVSPVPGLSEHLE
jgi:hypothetical protein